MQMGMRKVSWTVGLSVCLTGCGCVGLGEMVFLKPDPDPLPARPRPAQFTETMADLRISAEEVPPEPVPVVPANPVKAPASSTFIPLVPVPPPPLKGDRPAVSPAVGPMTSPPMQNVPPPLPQMLTPQQLYQQAAASYSRTDSYIARLTRRERGKTNHAEEIMVFTFRKTPWSIRFKWLAGPGAGREVLYVKDRYENKIHTLLAAGDVPLVSAGKVLAMPVDSPLVKAANRHPITDAGFGAMIEKLGEVIAANDRGNFRPGKLTALGLQQRADYDTPLYMLDQSVPPGADEDVPHGGHRVFGFSPENYLPVLSILVDHRGKELAYSRFDRIMAGVKLDDSDFNPGELGKHTDGVPEKAGTR
jgi:Protein of unknown function (DUF1571)